MKLFLGLGNPGKEYENTRHNVGFRAIDYINNNFFNEHFKEKLDNSYFISDYNRKKIILAKPLLYMNNSGIALKRIMNFFKLAPENIYIIYDDMDIKFGNIKLSSNSSIGGHNGIRSIMSENNIKKLNKIRIGIGRNNNIKMNNYVMGKFTNKENKLFSDYIFKILEKIFIDINIYKFNKVMSKYNCIRYDERASNSNDKR